MRFASASSRTSSGIALVIVLIVILVLAVMVGGFAFSMKVETTLARNAGHDHDLEWLGRSGVEMARYVLAQQMEPYDSLNQKWAGGPGSLAETNGVLADLDLNNIELGEGRLALKIRDTERKLNINVADSMTLQRALSLMGTDAGDYSGVIDSILDWIDADDDPHLSGRESDYYMHLAPQPYVAKNGPVDDLSELLLIYGVTPQMYWGSGSTNVPADYALPPPSRRRGRPEEPVYQVGFAELFTPVGARQINANTASQTVLQLVSGIDENIVLTILRARAGPDGAEGTDDDIPFRSPQEIPVPRMDAAAVMSLTRYFGVRSYGFEVEIEAEMAGTKKRYRALLWRNSPRDIQTLYFHAE